MSGLRLYNTLTRKKEDFAPIDPQNVRMYVCGPTVYDFAHIGNARPVIVFDVLFRLLKHLYPGSGKAIDGSRVTYVRNITDVDDKINARALERFGKDVAAGKLTLNQAIREVTEETANQFHADVAALGCLDPTQEPRATEHIGGMVGMIQRLIDNACAYVAAGEEGREVLFDVTSMPDYGALSNRRLADQQAGARVDVKDHKKNPGDFVLWKESTADQPGWDGVFLIAGDRIHIRGRPGWHIECSVMSDQLLWEAVKDQLSQDGMDRPHQFDIHGGGLDLIFPHHENEIAQSRCAHGTEAMANVWMHNGFLQVEGKKMAKSEGNFVTIHDLLQGDGRRPRAGTLVRLLMLSTHYRQPIDFTEAKLDYWYSKLCHWIETFNLYRSEEFNFSLYQGSVAKPSAAVINALCDDMNFAPVTAHLDQLAERAAANSDAAANELGANLIWLDLLEFGKEQLFRSGVSGKGGVGTLLHKYRDAIIDARMLSANNYGYLKIKSVEERKRQISSLEDSFASRFPEMISDGVKLEMSEHCDIALVAVEKNLDLDSKIQGSIDERLAFIRDKNWAEADRIRDELLAQGIQLKDSKHPQTGERVTTWEVKR